MIKKSKNKKNIVTKKQAKKMGYTHYFLCPACLKIMFYYINPSTKKIVESRFSLYYNNIKPKNGENIKCPRCGELLKTNGIIPMSNLRKIK